MYRRSTRSKGELSMNAVKICFEYDAQNIIRNCGRMAVSHGFGRARTS